MQKRKVQYNPLTATPLIKRLTEERSHSSLALPNLICTRELSYEVIKRLTEERSHSSLALPNLLCTRELSYEVKNRSIYMEIEPCDYLKPFIRCFWGTVKPYIQNKTDIPSTNIVIPDTCMDIIFDIHYSKNFINSSFCGINDSTFTTYSNNDDIGAKVSTFGIRFYAWAAILFSEDSMKGVKNRFFDLEHYFSKCKARLEPILFEVDTLSARKDIAEKFLIKHMHLERKNQVVMNAVYQILQYKGNIKMSHLAKEVSISNRHLERLFHENMGVSPKQLSSLVRYQYLWNDILFSSNFNVLDAVHKYGYTDQSHLLHDFKKYHTMLPSEAKQYALNDVAFLQENEESVR